VPPTKPADDVLPPPPKRKKKTVEEPLPPAPPAKRRKPTATPPAEPADKLFADARHPPEPTLLHSCGRCGLACDGLFTFAFGSYYHPNCFRCIRCDQVIGPPNCVTCRDAILCPSCAAVGEGHVCKACHGAILPFEDKVRPLGVNAFLHEACFRCYGCAGELSEVTFSLVGGQCFCPTCAPRFKNLRCAECGTAIVDAPVRVLHRMYHREHLKCYVCKCLIGGGAYIIHHNHVYCGVDGQPYVTTCSFCHGDFTNIADKIVWRGKRFHSRCFVCRVCCARVNENCKAIHNRPHCDACYNQRLADSDGVGGTRGRAGPRHRPERAVKRRLRFSIVFGNEIAGPRYRFDEFWGQSDSDFDSDDGKLSSSHASSRPSSGRPGSAVDSQEEAARTKSHKARRQSQRRAAIRRSIAPASKKDQKHKTHRRHRHAHHAPDEPRTRTKHHARHHGGGKEEIKVFKSKHRKRALYGEPAAPRGGEAAARRPASSPTSPAGPQSLEGIVFSGDSESYGD
jgi:hypothetical protein